MPETTVLKVLLHCDGCVSKVKRHIRRLEGVESFHVDQINSKVTVIGTVKPEVVLEKVLRAGKTAEFWPQSGEKENAAKAEETAEKSVVGGKKKKSSSDEASGSASKKQKNEKKVETEELEDVGDGEIVDETHVPAADDESDERVLIKAKKPRKKGIFRKG